MEELTNLQLNNYAEIFENASNYIYIKSVEEKYAYIYGNYNFRAISGTYKHKNLIQRTDEDMPWGDFTNDYRQHDNDTLSGLQYLQLDITKTGDGELTAIISRKFPLYASTGKINAIIGFTSNANHSFITMTNELLYYDKKPLRVGCYLHDHINTHPHLLLTPRESQCLFYVLRGRTSKEIAYELHVSPKTVDFHIENIKNKWNCHSRSDIFDKAYEYKCFNVIPPEIFNKINHIDN